MGKQVWKPGNMLYPLPAVMVSTADRKGNDNIITVAWTGTVCTDPAMVYISVRPERYSYHMIRESGEFVINLTTEELARAADWCGVKSGRDVDKWKEMELERGAAKELSFAPVIAQSPVNIECRVTEVRELGSHHMFLAEVLAVQVDERYMRKDGKFELNHTGLIAYSHGTYFSLGNEMGTFGWSVKKNAGKEPSPGKGRAEKSTGRNVGKEHAPGKGRGEKSIGRNVWKEPSPGKSAGRSTGKEPRIKDGEKKNRRIR